MSSKKPPSTKGLRVLHTKVKTARGRKASSTKWLQRQLNDPYVKKAKQEGYRSRAAYKLAELDDKFNFLRMAKTIVDIGCAPGGWLQVANERTEHAKIIGVDLLEMEPVTGTEFIQGDFLQDETIDKMYSLLENKQVDVVLSDMAASSCGHAATDHLRIVALCEEALWFAKKVLSEDGVFIAKMLQGGAEKDLFDDLKKNFKKVKHVKPPASRPDSAENYIVAIGFRGKNE